MDLSFSENDVSRFRQFQDVAIYHCAYSFPVRQFKTAMGRALLSSGLVFPLASLFVVMRSSIPGRSELGVSSYSGGVVIFPDSCYIRRGISLASMQHYPHLGMPVSIFRFVAYAIASVAGAILLSLLRHRFRQRCLQNIPGPSNPSLIWGKIHNIHIR